MDNLSVIEGNKLIAEFYAEKREGMPPNLYYRKGNLFSGFLIKDAAYHISWDWQVPAWAKIALAVKTLLPKLADVEDQAKWYFRMVSKYEEAVFQNKPENGQKIIVELINWYNNQK